MNDLISRDALIDYINLEYKDHETLQYEMLDLVKKQPIAFDIDKVIAKLEEELDTNYKKFKGDIFDFDPSNRYYNRYVGLQRAIEIIKDNLSESEVEE